MAAGGLLGSGLVGFGPVPAPMLNSLLVCVLQLLLLLPEWAVSDGRDPAKLAPFS